MVLVQCDCKFGTLVCANSVADRPWEDAHRAWTVGHSAGGWVQIGALPIVQPI